MNQYGCKEPKRSYAFDKMNMINHSKQRYFVMPSNFCIGEGA